MNSFSVPQPYTTDFQVEFLPKSPEANTVVTARIVTYSFNLDASYITWALDGSVIQKGTGKKTASFKTSDVGSTMSLTVYITTDAGQEVKKTFNIKIGEIDLLWEAQTYTPLFYRGKAKPIAGAPIKITAIPHGLTSQNNLIYEWRRDYKKIASASGTGKSSFSFIPFKTSSKEIIKVKITTLDEKNSIEKTITIKEENTRIIFYEEDPRMGPLFNKALREEKNVQGKSEILVRAEPYFFPKDRLSYSWTMNNQNIETLIGPNVVGLIIPTGKEGQSIIQVEIKSALRLLQKITNSLTVKF